MRRLLLAFAVICFGSLFASAASAQDTFQVFGGYSYLRQSLALTEAPACGCSNVLLATTANPNLNGWEISGTYNAYKWLGVTADFSGHYGTVQGSSDHLQTYMFGPQVHLPGPVSPFAHVLLGGAHETVGSGGGISGYAINPISANAFAVAVGAGIDIKVAPFVSFRPIQLDYLVTRFGSATQNQPRASAGVVFHF
jgi:hypothetical protein